MFIVTAGQVNIRIKAKLEFYGGCDCGPVFSALEL